MTSKKNAKKLDIGNQLFTLYNQPRILSNLQKNTPDSK
jgi:hypothetical protein